MTYKITESMKNINMTIKIYVVVTENEPFEEERYYKK
jgi:hypothetical protein